MKNIIRGVAILGTIAAAACGSAKESADSTAALAAIDTLKPAGTQMDSMAAGATTAGTTNAAGTAKATTAPAATKTTTKTGTKIRTDTTKILGRDSVIMPKGKGGLPPMKSDSL